MPVEITDAIRARRGVAAARLGPRPAGDPDAVAAREPGVNVNQLLDGRLLDPLSGTAVLNGFPSRSLP